MPDKKSPPELKGLGELRRFVLKTDKLQEINLLVKVIQEKHLSRRDLGIILLYLGVQPGCGPEAFDIHTHNDPEHL